MGLDASLGRENRPAGKTHKCVHRLYRNSSNVAERDAEEKPTSRAYLLNTLEDEFEELSTSPSRKSMPCRFNGVKVESNGMLKRGSVYQSSREIRKLIKQREVRRKPELALSDESFLSFEIVNSPSKRSPNEKTALDQQKRRPHSFLNPERNLTSFDNAQAVLTDTTEFLDLSFRLLPEEQANWSSQCPNVSQATQSSSDSYLEISLSPDISECSHTSAIHGNVEGFRRKRTKIRINTRSEDGVHILPKSFSAKVGTCKTLHQPEIDPSKVTQRNRFSPIMKMFDPMKKSKSQRNPSLSNTVACNLTPPNPSSYRIDTSSRKSSLSGLSSSIDHKRIDRHDQLFSGDEEMVVTAASAAHLHGTLKLESKQSVPSFEFSLKDAEEVLSAKTWKAQNAFNWVYTFHGDRRRQTLPIVGQMQVSCYFCSELSSNGLLDNFAVTEFVLQDISQLKRNSTACDERFPSPDLQPRKDIISASIADGDSRDLNVPSEPETRKNPSRVADADFPSEASASGQRAAPIESRPQLEVAAIVVQIPFGGKRSLKDRLRDDACNKQLRDLTGNGRDGASIDPQPVNGPSPLLDRWRSGGACDCGGWDMACPITVLDNSGGEDATEIRGGHLSLKLFVQGTKDKTPALIITTREDGLYSIHFHAQFSKLQAFSICVAVLHSLEAFGLLSQEKNGQRLHSSSLKLLLEEEVRQLLEAVAKEEHRKVNKKQQQSPGPYQVDPPISPIGRV
ncbi:unnamed protein product [Spirodela intermedia]|uniref:Uncharacterized protein n=1 Tax=Spirodela intermedia TaxID=51605 RepID=A0A7I8IES5_SPIIN|nr:unnamed protein product [Spirodela intermedia]CAA6655603.1 unnamed protein product [Spirodela intermedia]